MALQQRKAREIEVFYFSEDLGFQKSKKLNKAVYYPLNGIHQRSWSLMNYIVIVAKRRSQRKRDMTRMRNSMNSKGMMPVCLLLPSMKIWIKKLMLFGRRLIIGWIHGGRIEGRRG